MCDHTIRPDCPSAALQHRYCRLRIWPLLLALSLLTCIGAAPVVVCADTSPETSAEPPGQHTAPRDKEDREDREPGEAVESDEIAVLEASRQGVREASEWAARHIDSWFGDLPFEKGGKISHGRIRLRTVWRESDDVDVNLRFRLRMTLPNLENKAHVLIGRENERDLVSDRPETVVEQQRLLRENKKDDQTFFAGIGLDWLDPIRVSIGLRDLHKPYVKLRYTAEWQLDDRNRLEASETGFWALDDGFGATTTLDYEHALSPVLNVRWLNSGTVSEENDGLDWYSSLGLYRLFGEHTLFSGELLADGETGKEVAVQEYGVLVKWRQPVYRDWLLGEFSVGHYWEREDVDSEREGKWALGVGVQMNF